MGEELLKRISRDKLAKEKLLHLLQGLKKHGFATFYEHLMHEDLAAAISDLEGKG